MPRCEGPRLNRMGKAKVELHLATRQMHIYMRVREAEEDLMGRISGASARKGTTGTSRPTDRN